MTAPAGPGPLGSNPSVSARFQDRLIFEPSIPLRAATPRSGAPRAMTAPAGPGPLGSNPSVSARFRDRLIFEPSIPLRAATLRSGASRAITTPAGPGPLGSNPFGLPSAFARLANCGSASSSAFRSEVSERCRAEARQRKGGPVRCSPHALRQPSFSFVSHAGRFSLRSGGESAGGGAMRILPFGRTTATGPFVA